MCWFLGYDFVLLQGSRGGAVMRVLASCQHGQGLNIAPASIVWVKFVAITQSCFKVLFLWFSGFLPCTKANTLKLQFYLKTVDEEPL